MDRNGSGAWMNASLLYPQQEEHEVHQHHALYAPDLPPLQNAEHLVEALEQGQFDTFPQHLSTSDFQNTLQDQCVDSPQFTALQFSSSSDQLGLRASGSEVDPISARKVHKADREKLRRDRLNEQFGELASALDPDRPKNDKASILSDSVQALAELRSEVKRLKTEHTALLEESKDLSQEKSELREEKSILKNETEQLQCQLQQRMRMLMPWASVDPSLMLGASAFPYPMAVPSPVPTSLPLPSSSTVSQPVSTQATISQVATQPPYLSLASPAISNIPFPPAATFAMHPSLQAYAMFANRPAGPSIPFFPYPHYPPPVAGPHSHVERPYPQYPTSRSYPTHPHPVSTVSTAKPGIAVEAEASSTSDHGSTKSIVANNDQAEVNISPKEAQEEAHSDTSAGIPQILKQLAKEQEGAPRPLKIEMKMEPESPSSIHLGNQGGFLLQANADTKPIEAEDESQIISPAA